jgi:FkbH-like protein
MKLPETHAEYINLARQLEESDEETSTNLAIISSFTADFLKPYIIVESFAIQNPIKPWFAPFGQFEQMILDSSSPLWNSKPQIIWIALRIEDIDRYFIHAFSGLEPNEARDRLSVIRERLILLARAARDKFAGPILVSNMTADEQGPRDIFDPGNSSGLLFMLAGENRLLAEGLAKIPDAHIFDYAGTVSSFGALLWRDPRLWHMARIPFGQNAQKRLSVMLVRTASATLRPPAKCLVLDLDNTLWGGVLGDDGLANIVIGDDYPGSIFKDFQAALLGLRNRGFLLAIASKNDFETVKNALDTHPEMILRSRHFADIEANWDPKPVNLKRIAEKLNIGLNSLVFIDDNPLERVHVRAELPMVQVIELPPEPIGFAGAVLESHLLDRPRLLREDAARAEMYQQETLRQEFGSHIADVDRFLSELGMHAEMGLLGPRNLERVHQLIHKTNQFNLTTRRHPMAELERFGKSPESHVAWLRLKDRFGELGLVCVGIIRQTDSYAWEIDTFLMSCRVMGRGVEDAFLSYLAELALSHDARLLRGIYIKTAKNTPVERFFQERNFKEVDDPDETIRIYEIELTRDTFPWPSHIERINAHE